MIKIKNIDLSFGDKQVFKDFSTELCDEGAVIFMGESGVGKTSLLRILAGLIKPQNGTVEGLQGRKISFVFQEPRLLADRTALKNVALVSDVQRAKELLVELGLKDELNQSINHLSGGQKQRVAIARALAFSDDVVILDEPFSNLDAENRRMSAELIGRAKLVLMVTHDQADCALFPHATKILL